MSHILGAFGSRHVLCIGWFTLAGMALSGSSRIGVRQSIPELTFFGHCVLIALIFPEPLSDISRRFEPERSWYTPRLIVVQRAWIVASSAACRKQHLGVCWTMCLSSGRPGFWMRVQLQRHTTGSVLACGDIGASLVKVRSRQDKHDPSGGSRS